MSNARFRQCRYMNIIILGGMILTRIASTILGRLLIKCLRLVDMDADSGDGMRS